MDIRLLVFFLVAICFLMVSSIRSFKIIAIRSKDAYSRLPQWARKIEWVYWALFILMLILKAEYTLWVVIFNFIVSIVGISAKAGIFLCSYIDTLFRIKNTFGQMSKNIELSKTGDEAKKNSNNFKKYLLGLLLILFLGMLVFMFFSAGEKNSEENIELPMGDKKELVDLVQKDQEKVEIKFQNGVLFLVTRVVDGDTIEIENGIKVRYIGIDTPETVHPNKAIECFGIEASNYNKLLLEGKQVRLEKDITDMDKYGRLLRYVFVGDVFVNLKMVEDGYAKVYTYPPDVKYQDLFLEAQQRARKENKGLWGGCDKENIDMMVEKTMKADIVGSCDIKGNINSDGEKIYHLPQCASYSKTKINEIRGEKWFCSEQEAIDAGWRKALNC